MEALPVSSSPRQRNNLFGLLDLPIHSVVTIDGVALMLPRDDFIGVSASVAPGFRALMVRGGGGSAQRRQQHPSATTVGFVFLEEARSDPETFIRRFDRTTEEMSSHPVDTSTERNLLQQWECGKIEPHRLVSYDQVVSPNQQQLWQRLTDCISRKLLDIRGIHNGDKLVPGSYSSSSSSLTDDDLSLAAADGHSVRYPPIPMLHAPPRRHEGTRQFLQEQTPARRTAFYYEWTTTLSRFEYLLKTVYHQDWELLLGDVQLAFCLFLNLQCYSSWIHWRDLVAMLSSIDAAGMQQYSHLFSSLFTVLSAQMENIQDTDILDDVHVTEEDGFLIPSLRSLLDTAQAVPELRQNDALGHLCKVLSDTFPEHFVPLNDKEEVYGANNNPPLTDIPLGVSADQDDICGDDSDDLDGPVLVAAEEVEESIARSQKQSTEAGSFHSSEFGHSRDWFRERYPLLLAAMDGSSIKEDVLMTCARVLYDASDVSLVREAAAYLQEVEASRTREHCL